MLLQKADHIFIDMLHKHKLYDAIWQAFAVLLPTKTVGVMGDSAHLRPCLRPAGGDVH